MSLELWVTIILTFVGIIGGLISWLVKQIIDRKDKDQQQLRQDVEFLRDAVIRKSAKFDIVKQELESLKVSLGDFRSDTTDNERKIMEIIYKNDEKYMKMFSELTNTILTNQEKGEAKMDRMLDLLLSLTNKK